MRIDHRGFDIAMAQQFLDRSNVVATLEQMSGKGMPEGVRKALISGSAISAGWRTLWKKMKHFTQCQ
jgi:hypothetical protein